MQSPITTTINGWNITILLSPDNQLLDIGVTREHHDVAKAGGPFQQYVAIPVIMSRLAAVDPAPPQGIPRTTQCDVCTPVDNGDDCVRCDRDTSAGSGLWIDRIPADGYRNGDPDQWPTLRRGYLCYECQTSSCSSCGRIEVDLRNIYLRDGERWNLARYCKKCVIASLDDEDIAECDDCGDMVTTDGLQTVEADGGDGHPCDWLVCFRCLPAHQKQVQ